MKSKITVKSDESVFAHPKPSLKHRLLPPIIGLAVIVFAWGLMNSQVIVGKVHTMTYEAPSAVTQPVEIKDENPKPDPSKPARITVDKTGVDAPIILDQKVIDEKNFQVALRDGVVHYPGTALPSQPGNSVIFGHSSGQVWAPGDYKFVFTHLEKLEKDDRIVLSYQGIEYVYTVNGKKVVPPTDVSVLAPTKGNTLTLITCTPVGTNENRLIITAGQTSPKPAAKKKPVEAVQPAPIQTLPGDTSPSLWESIRSLF